MNAPSKDVIRFPIVAAAIMAAVVAVVAALALWQKAQLSDGLSAAELRVLRASHRAVERFHGSDLALRGDTIAGNQAVTGYIAQALDSVLPGTEPDYTSVVDLLEERRSQLGLSMVAILGGDGAVVATTDSQIGPSNFGDSPLFREARDSKLGSNGLLTHEERLLGMRILPLAEYGFSEIYLLIASPLDQNFAQSLAQGVGEGSKADVALLSPTAQGFRVIASTLPPKIADTLPAALVSDARMKTQRASGDFAFEVAGKRRMATSVPLFGDTSARVLMIASAEPDPKTHAAGLLPLQVGCVLALLAVGLALWWMWSRWVAPLEALLRVVEYAADSGDMHLKALSGGSALVSRLAQAFSRFCARIAGSPRE